MTSPAIRLIVNLPKRIRLPNLKSCAGALLMMAYLLGGCRSGGRLPEIGSKTYSDYLSTFYVGLAALQVGDDVRADAKL